MKIVGVVFVLLALGAIVVLALWPHEDSAAKRRSRDKDSSDADTSGIITGSAQVYPGYRHHADHGHHGDHGGGHDGGGGGSGGHGH